MSFLLRSVRSDDLHSLLKLTRQFTLLNLPSSRDGLEAKIHRSERSFSENLPRKEAEYLFVVEDTETGEVVGSSLIMAKHGTPESPHHFFKIERRNHYSQSLGIGFTQPVLIFKSETDGPSEIGGLLVDEEYRRRPEKLGYQISLVRFSFMGMAPERFEDNLICELSPPLTADGRSEFWEALGRRFTGLPYKEADRLSQVNSEFIRSLFPHGDIYLSLLDAKARIDLGQVAEATRPAVHLLKKLGFEYLEEVDPFDGGPHYGVVIKDMEIIRNGNYATVAEDQGDDFKLHGFVSLMREKGQFRSVYSPIRLQDEEVILPARSHRLLDVSVGDQVYVTYIE